MTSRIQLALDGDLPVYQLTADEVQAYHRLSALCAAALEPLAATPAIDVSAAVLRRIAARRAPRRPLASAAHWLWAPRPVSLRFRPALALAAAASIALVAAFIPASPSAAPARMVVEFRLGAPDAHNVSLVGDFNSWKPVSTLRESAPGVWTVSVSLEPGVYNYGFMVDGRTLRLDPLAPRVADGFGGESSRVTVQAPVIRS
jgi:hypothetical protein